MSKERNGTTEQLNMALARIPLSEVQRDPVAAYRSGGGNPIGVEQDGVVLFFLVSAIDVVQGQVDTVDPADVSPADAAPPATSASGRSVSGRVSERRGPATREKERETDGDSKSLGETVNLTEAAALTGKSKSTISRNIAGKRLEAEEVGNTLQIKISDLERVFTIKTPTDIKEENQPEGC